MSNTNYDIDGMVDGDILLGEETEIDEPSFVWPSNPADRKKIKQSIDEAVNCQVRIDMERESKKDIVDLLNSDYGIPKKLLNQLIRIQHKRNFSEVKATNEELELLVECVNGVV